MKSNFIVNDDFADSRLDRWFRKNVCEVPQSLIEKNIRKGNIKVNYKRKKSSYKIKKGDEIIIRNISFIPNKHKKVTIKYKPTTKDLSSSNFFIENNENFVIINKPRGIAVQAGTKSRKNIIDIVNSTEAFRDSQPYPVHRIDKETTGILIIAKNRKYAQLFTSMFRMRKINKTYLSIVVGVPSKNRGTMKDELFYYEGKKKYKNLAITDYTVLDTNKNFSLLKLNPQTGRKHQLRKQLLIHGLPILGDNKYRIFDKYPNKNNKLMLHSYKINFSIHNNKYIYSADIPIEFKRTLKEKYLKIFL